MVEASDEAIEQEPRPANPSSHHDPSSKKKKPICRFYITQKGCRAGDQCKFQHPASPGETTESMSSELRPAAEAPEAAAASHSPRPSPAAPSPAVPAPAKAVPKPIPKALTDDPRAFQLMQIKRRFNPIVSEKAEATTLAFDMKPSDPDFPYDIEALSCTLTVPKEYPSVRPGLTIRNKDIPRGFQINIERGFDRIADASPNAYLLGLMNRLDQQLESILGGQKADTITIVSNRAPQVEAQPAETPVPAPVQPTSEAAEQLSTQGIDQAKAKRQADVRQLEARFRKLPHFVKSQDGSTYTLPLDAPKRSTWPSSLQPLRSFQLKVPQEYPLKPLEIRLFKDAPEAKAVETAFKERSISDQKASITQHVNYLSSHVKEMAVVVPAEKPPVSAQASSAPMNLPPVAAAEKSGQPDSASNEYGDSHIKYIPRPPEWDADHASEDDSSSDSYESEGEESSDDEQPAADTEEQQQQQPVSAAPAERGILLSLPRLELHGIELLELTSLSLTVKCERCKDTMDIEKLRTSPENSKMREVNCKKCATTLAIRFRADMIHANSVRAGYLDLDGCTVVDLLPSTFAPTCSDCSTQYPIGVVAVRGDNAIAICREDHKKMVLRIHEVKFLLVSASAVRASRAPGRRKPKENLGIVAGTELPNRGRCRHYKKSYRWFRFSCCQKVYACDRCHDDENDHPIEHANRMLCGYCSREQNYRPEDCATCHAALTGSKGRGFWEGGKGTRDPTKMSRKDPRKFRNRNKTKYVKG